VNPRLAFVVSHTHWDREWYATLPQFRVDLCRAVKRILHALEEEPDFDHFMLDGQSIVLEDYLQIHPEDRERIARHVQAGRLAIGPWYVLPDEFLVSAESTVRNLLIGHRVAESIGPVQRGGYMPDSFGHIAQMPQILRQAGMDSFIFTRGGGDEQDRVGLEFRWLAPDGSEVLAVRQCDGYCNAAGLGLAEIWHAHTQREIDLGRAVSQVRELFDKMSQESKSDIYLLNNGCDHFPPQRELSRVLDALRREFPETEFRHASLDDYIDALKGTEAELERFTGELLSGRDHPILSGVWSARMPLKLANDRAQNTLTRHAEPLAAYLHFMHGKDYPSGALEHAWKLLLQNHPHDSICGCSTDEVHRQMGPRFDEVIQGGEQLIRRGLQELAPTFARRAEADHRTVLCIANSLPEARSEIVERLVVLQPGVDPSGLRLYDEVGVEVPFRELDRAYVERFWGVDYRVALDHEEQADRFEVYRQRFGKRMLRDAERAAESDCYLTLQFVAELPALGHAQYALRPGTSKRAEPAGSVTVSQRRIENEFYRLELNADGSFDLHVKASGETLRDLNRLEDCADIGDEYDFCPARADEVLHPPRSSSTPRVLQDGGLRGQLALEIDWLLPEKLDDDRERRSSERVRCPLELRIELRHGSPMVYIEWRIDNRAADHRLRAVFPTEIRTDRIVSDGHFLVDDRPLSQPERPDWAQPPVATVPQQDFSALEDGEHGLALLAQGLPEVQATTNDGGRAALHLTLLRCVDWLSRDDLPTRNRINAGPTLYTPEAQCRGTHRFRCALIPYMGSWRDAGIKTLSERYRTPPLSVQGVEDGMIEGGPGLLSKRTRDTCITAIKRHESRDTLVVRLFNLTAETVTETLETGREIRAAWDVDLLERRRSPLEPSRGRQLQLEFGAHALRTVEIEF